MSEMESKFREATYWVGCTSESASQLYLSYESMMDDYKNHQYIAAFDWQGLLASEAKIVWDEENGRDAYDFVFDF